MIRSRYRALNTIMSLASGFTGILDKFTGAVAAYSTRKLIASQPNILPADHGDGAAAAYSLRKVKASYSGNCIDVRRSSDNEIASIGFSGNELDTTALEAFVGSENLFFPSETFTGWGNIGGSTITSNTTETDDPFGGSNATKVTAGSSVLIYKGTFTNVIRTQTFYAKAGTAETFGMYFGSGFNANFNISTDSPSVTSTNNTSATITAVGNGWYRCSATLTSVPSGNYFAGVNFSPTSGTTFYIFGAQLEGGTTATNYNKTTTDIGGDGFVTKWYDQSGNENDATQGTDNDQPQIVDAGSTILENGKPAIQFDGVDDLLDIGQSIDLYSLASEWSIFMDAKIQDYTLQSFQRVLTNDSSISSPDIPLGVQFRNTGDVYFFNNGSVDSTTITSATQRNLVSFIKRSSDTIYAINGTSATGTKGSVDFTTGLENTTIGNSPNGTTRPAKLKTAELIIFDSDQSANRQDIEWNINNHYNIYTDSWDKQSAMQVRRAIDNETTNIGFVGKDLDTTALETFATESSPVLDDYTGAAAAYSLRKVRSAYTGDAIRVRRSSDHGLQDIGFDSNGDLDTTALLAFVNQSGNAYTSDFRVIGDPPVDQEDMGETGGTGAGGQSIADVSDAYKFTQDGLTGIHRAVNPTNANIVGGNVSVSFDYYLPSGQTSNRILFRTNNAADAQVDLTTTDDWTTYSTTFSGIAGDQFWFYSAIIGQGLSFTGNGSDHFYLKNIVVTQTDADGAVTTWYDQSVPTETYDSDFSAGVDGFSATNPSNNTVTRLASVTDDYSTTVENVLQFEAATAGTNITQQLRNNLGLTIGGTYKVSFKMLIDSENETLVKAGLYDGAGSTPEDIVFGGKLTETGRWTTFTDVPITQENARLLFAGLDSSDNFSFNSTEGDKFYIADVSVDEVNDATQSTASEQPLVVSGGTLVTDTNGDVSIYNFVDGSLVRGIIPSYDQINSQAYSLFVVAEIDSTSSQGMLLGDNSGGSSFIYASTQGDSSSFILSNYTNINSFIDGATFTPTTRGEVHTGMHTDVPILVSAFYDTQTSFSGALNYPRILGYSSGTTFMAKNKIKEWILFESDQSGNRTGIEGNIGRYYNIDGFRDVFVSKWYDQSGNFNHAENSTDTQQPQIVDGGTLVTENGKAAIEFDGADDYFDTNLGTLTESSVFMLFRKKGAGSTTVFGGSGIRSLGYVRESSRHRVFYVNWGAENITDSRTSPFTELVSFFRSEAATTLELFRDGVNKASLTSLENTVINPTNLIGKLGGVNTYYFEGLMQELIIFDSDQSANREDIENNINKHFKIYEE